MNQDLLREKCLAEEAIAHIHGWDFSHIRGRYEEEKNLPLDYETIIRRYISPKQTLLDIDTGGGEFLLSLKHPFCNTSATEGYPPNVDLCKNVLLPFGIDFHEANGASQLPFDSDAFDIVINRHGDFNVNELFRVMKPDGVFITEQVGAENDRKLIDMLLPGTKVLYPEQYLWRTVEKFRKEGFEILDEREAYRPIKFYDIGALVWFARIIEWEFPGFSVDNCFSQLCTVQKDLEQKGEIEGYIHRFLLVAKKPKT